MEAEAMLCITDRTHQALNLTGHLIRFITPSKFLSSPLDPKHPGELAIVLTSRNGYGCAGYHAALAAEARGYRVFPTPEALFAASPTALNSDEAALLRKEYPFALGLGRNMPKSLSGHENKVPHLAVLFRGGASLPPSDLSSLRQFALVARTRGIRVSVRNVSTFRDFNGVDGLFLRCPNTYWFARCAEAMSIPVIDRAASILRCNSKVFLAELCRVRHFPTPETSLVTLTNVPESVSRVRKKRFPIVIKHPSLSYSRGVFKISDPRRLTNVFTNLSKTTDVAVVQEFVKSELDWRVGILDGEPLFAARYRMVPYHWKVVKYHRHRPAKEGKAEAIGLTNLPKPVLELAIAAAKRFGEGLYGVDIKETKSGPLLMEVNDNPDLYMGIEVYSRVVWERIADWFAVRMRS